MKFSFSEKFRLSFYAELLRDLSTEVDTYRVIYGINIKDMMADIHISYPSLKVY